MRIIQNPIHKLQDGSECAHCNFTMNIKAKNDREYVISISADNNLGNGKRKNGKHDCYRTQLALFLDGEEAEKHTNGIMQNALGKDNYIDHPSEDELYELIYYLKNNIK